MILLKEFNYLDDLNRELKNKVAVTLEEYRYLSIENRTLLNIKSKIAQLEQECRRNKEEKDTFKRRLIILHRQHTQLIQEREDEEEDDSRGGAAVVGKGKSRKNGQGMPAAYRGGSPGSRSNSPRRSPFGQEESLFSLSSVSTEHNHSVDYSSPI